MDRKCKDTSSPLGGQTWNDHGGPAQDIKKKLDKLIMAVWLGSSSIK